MFLFPLYNILYLFFEVYKTFFCIKYSQTLLKNKAKKVIKNGNIILSNKGNRNRNIFIYF